LCKKQYRIDKREGSGGGKRHLEAEMGSDDSGARKKRRKIRGEMRNYVGA